MSSSDWEEVKRLAADFQRAQLTTSVQRLSERNCVELINKLNELNLLKLHYTTDGRCYVTPQQLHKEIMDELHVAGGRIDVVSLSSTLLLDLSVVQLEVAALLHQHRDLVLVLGQLLSPQYEDKLAEEVNEKLLRNGAVAVEDLAAEYELPGTYIRQVIESKLKEDVIHAVQDSSNPGSFYTEQFLSRMRARIRGLMTAVTVPTAVHKLGQLHGCDERLFRSSLERLVASGRVCGELTGSGSKQSKSCTFVPAIHSRTQGASVDAFLQQNGYLEFEFLRQLGVEDPSGYITRRYAASHELLLLPEVCVGSALLQQLYTAVDEALVTYSFVDVAMIVPSCFSEAITERLVEYTLQQRRTEKQGKAKKGQAAGGTGALVVAGSYVLSEVLVAGVKEKLETAMAERGQKLVAAGGYKPKVAVAKVRQEDLEQSSRKDDRRKKAAGGKSGGGTQGRETKTRSTKSKKTRRGQHDNDSDEEPVSDTTKFPDVEFLPVDELASVLSKMSEFEDADEEMVDELSLELHGWSKKVFAAICERCYQSLVCSGGSSKKKSFQQLQERVLSLLTTCRLAERGTKEFGDDLQHQLSRYLLRTQGSELVAELLLHISDDVAMAGVPAKEVSPEARLQLVTQLSPASEGGCRELFLAAHKALGGADLTAFFAAVEETLPEAGIMLPKKKDTKKERQVLSSHRTLLLEQLSSCCEPALCLHLAALLLCHAVTGHIMHASGKFVPHLLAFLKPHLPHDLHLLLHEFQGLVIEKLTSSSSGDSLGCINGRLEELTPQLKERAITYKKAADTSAV